MIVFFSLLNWVLDSFKAFLRENDLAEHNSSRICYRSRTPPCTRDGAVSACRPGRGASGARGDQHEQTPADGPRRVRFYGCEVGAVKTSAPALASPSPARERNRNRWPPRSPLICTHVPPMRWLLPRRTRIPAVGSAAGGLIQHQGRPVGHTSAASGRSRPGTKQWIQKKCGKPGHIGGVVLNLILILSNI
jgi:hypothetical protein